MPWCFYSFEAWIGRQSDEGRPTVFYQLLFPISDPKQSGIGNDLRMPYFTILTMCTNIYAATSGAGAGMGHDWVPVTPPELLWCTAVPVRNGALDGRPSTLHHHWSKDDPRFCP
jgi:hypothetical protein